MKTENPYERRNWRRRTTSAVESSDTTERVRRRLTARPVPLPDSRVTLTEVAGALDGITREKAAAAAEHGYETAAREFEVQTNDACRRAWDQGREAGRAEAHAELMDALQQQFGQRIHNLGYGIERTLAKKTEDGRKSPKPSRRHLRFVLEHTHELLKDLVHGHHREFQPAPPADPEPVVDGLVDAEIIDSDAPCSCELCKETAAAAAPF